MFLYIILELLKIFQCLHFIRTIIIIQSIIQSIIYTKTNNYDGTRVLLAVYSVVPVLCGPMGGTNTCCGVACSSVGAQASACCLYSVLEYRTSYLHCPEITEAERRREWVSFWYGDIKWELYRREERVEGRGEGVGRGKWGITCSNCSSWLYQPWQATLAVMLPHLDLSSALLRAPACLSCSELVTSDQPPTEFSSVHCCLTVKCYSHQDHHQ